MYFRWRSHSGVCGMLSFLAKSALVGRQMEIITIITEMCWQVLIHKTVFQCKAMLGKNALTQCISEGLRVQSETEYWNGEACDGRCFEEWLKRKFANDQTNQTPHSSRSTPPLSSSYISLFTAINLSSLNPLLGKQTK